MKVKELIARLTALNIPEAEVCIMNYDLHVCDDLECESDSVVVLVIGDLHDDECK